MFQPGRKERNTPLCCMLKVTTTLRPANTVAWRLHAVERQKVKELMKAIHDYFYRIPNPHPIKTGRCRVRMYKAKNGAHIVLLTELTSNTGESIAAASDRIATDLVIRWGLNPKSTRWLEHVLPQDGHAAEFGEWKFTWGKDRVASDPQWKELDSATVEELTDETLATLNRALGDVGRPTRAEEEQEEGEKQADE